MANTLNERRDERREMMLEGPVLKVIPTIAIPMIISMLIDSLYSMADTYFVSQLGTAAVAAVGVNDAVLHFMRSLSMGFGVGASSYISRLMGAKREEEACKVGTTSLLTGMVILTVLSAAAYLVIEPMVMILGATEQSKAHAVDYAMWILISAPITAGEVSLSQMLRAEGSTGYSMIGMVSGCVINVVLDPIFINVLDMGVGGAALATTISKTISFFVLLYPYLRKKAMVELKFRYFTPKWAVYKEIARMGIPTVLRMSLMSTSGVVMNNIAGSYSDAALAAVSVANKSMRLVGSAIMGFGQGFQPLAGYCWGAGKYRRIREAFWACSGIGAVGGALLGLVMFIFAPQLVGIFAAADDAELIAIGTLMIRTQCVTLIPHVWTMIVNGMFQALGRAVSSTFLGMSRQLICLIPSVIILSAIFGVNGVACAQAVADLLSACFAAPMVYRLFRELKKLIAEREAEQPAATAPAAAE